MGKGVAIDRAAETLRESGVTHALIHGGTSTVLGMCGGNSGSGWKVSIASPRGEEPLATFELCNRALSVSGAEGGAARIAANRTDDNTQRDHNFPRTLPHEDALHIVDPRTGRRAGGAWLAAVATKSAADSDALSTALLVLGEQGIELLASRFPDASLLLALPDTASPNGLRVILHEAGCAGAGACRN